jgi:trans-aconitate methyltransferase
MSRLDSFIRRMTAQRDVLNHVAALSLLPGDVLEIGLGNGRTFSHLRERFPDRRITAFDRAMLAHGSSVPDHFVAGEICDTAQAFVGRNAALVHADIGQGYPDRDALTLEWLPGLTAGLLGPGGIAASGLPLDHPALAPLPLPATVDEGRYFLYRRA